MIGFFVQQTNPQQELVKDAVNYLKFNVVRYSQGIVLPGNGQFDEIVIPKTGLYDFSIWCNHNNYELDRVYAAIQRNDDVLFLTPGAGEKIHAIANGKIPCVQGDRIKAIVMCVFPEGEEGDDPIIAVNQHFSMARVA